MLPSRRAMRIRARVCCTSSKGSTARPSASSCSSCSTMRRSGSSGRWVRQPTSSSAVTPAQAIASSRSGLDGTCRHASASSGVQRTKAPTMSAASPTALRLARHGSRSASTVHSQRTTRIRSVPSAPLPPASGQSALIAADHTINPMHATGRWISSPESHSAPATGSAAEITMGRATRIFVERTPRIIPFGLDQRQPAGWRVR